MDRGEGDATAVDCVTYAFWCRHDPEMAPKVRVLACTPPSPATPFVTSIATPATTVTILRTALRNIVHEQRYRAVRERLMLADIVDVPEARYRMLLDYEREAAALGYPALA